jgi:hypothetical protein
MLNFQHKIERPSVRTAFCVSRIATESPRAKVSRSTVGEAVMMLRRNASSNPDRSATPLRHAVSPGANERQNPAVSLTFWDWRIRQRVERRPGCLWRTDFSPHPSYHGKSTERHFSGKTKRGGGGRFESLSLNQRLDRGRVGCSRRFICVIGSVAANEFFRDTVPVSPGGSLCSRPN